MTNAGWLCEWPDQCDMVATVEYRTIQYGRFRTCRRHGRRYQTLSQGERDRAQANRQPPRAYADHSGPSTIPDRATAYNEHRWYPVTRTTPHRPRYRPR